MTASQKIQVVRIINERFSSFFAEKGYVFDKTEFSILEIILLHDEYRDISIRMLLLLESNTV